jgi:hypothetical protein|tara:strand:- start:11170 stop:11427 length:258 start_codon:yes stop_codon:yes gene_type:complete
MKKRIKALARIVAVFFKLFKPHVSDRREVIADDLRKIGTYSLGLALVAGIVAGDKITDTEALAIFGFGLIVWLIGIGLSSKPKED